MARKETRVIWIASDDTEHPTEESADEYELKFSVIENAEFELGSRATLREVINWIFIGYEVKPR